MPISLYQGSCLCLLAKIVRTCTTLWCRVYVTNYTQSPSRFSKWRIERHISCDSSWFSPDTCILTLLSIWTWKIPHQTFSHVRFTLLNYSTVGTWSHRLAFILCWLTPRNKRNENIVVLILLVKKKMLTTKSCRRKSHSQLLVSELFSSGTNSTYSNCDFWVHIHKNDQEWLYFSQ